MLVDISICLEVSFEMIFFPALVGTALARASNARNLSPGTEDIALEDGAPFPRFILQIADAGMNMERATRNGGSMTLDCHQHHIIMYLADGGLGEDSKTKIRIFNELHVPNAGGTKRSSRM